MSSKVIKESLSIGDIFHLLEDLGAEPKINGKTIESRTICHGGDKRKLFYYENKKYFHCYTDCAETFDIFGLIMKVKNIEFSEASKFIRSYFNIKYDPKATSESNKPVSFFEKFKMILFPTIEYVGLNESIMNYYWELYHKQWLQEFISIEAMKKFKIRYSILDNAVIILHRHWKTGEIIGIRQRNFDKKLIDEGKKYMPVYYKKVVLKHATGGNLYGLYENMENILRIGKIIIFESEKSVLQLESFNKDFSIGVAISGSSLTDSHKQILKNLNINEVIIALDKEFYNLGDVYDDAQRLKIIAMTEDLSKYFCVSTIYDFNNDLGHKQSPTDKGLDIFRSLYKERTTILNCQRS